MKRSEIIAKRALEKLGNELEQEYRQERQIAAEALYNGFADVISELKPSIETLLYVLEMIRHSMLEQKYDQLFGPGAQAAASDEKQSSISMGVM